MGKLVLRFFLTIFLLCVMAAIALFGFLYYSQYKPSSTEQVLIRNPQQLKLIPNEQYTITTFNIGFSSMDNSNKQSDVHPALSEPRTTTQIQQNLDYIISQLQTLKSDFYTLQEVDTEAKRSQFINQSETIAKQLSEHSASFAFIYQSPFIPFPLKEQLGALNSGLLTLSKYSTDTEIRYALPSSTDFVGALSTPQYALLETILPVRGNKNLVITNLQLAHTETGSTLAQEQITYLNDYIKTKATKDNYLILSGDWAHFIVTPTFKSSELWPLKLQALPSLFNTNHMTWAIDKFTPTTRSSEDRYEHGISFVSITDGFLVSNNIEVMSTVTSQLQFVSSDHNPVTMRFILK